MSTTIKISPEKLMWAAERGGISIDKLSEIFPKAVDWIYEDSFPTVKQLEKFSKKVHVPFGYLFLDKPPIEKLPITFYRSNGDVVENPPLVIRDIVNQLKFKQDWLKDFLIENKYDSLYFINSLQDFPNISVKSAADLIRDALNLSETWYCETNKKGVFRYWIDKIEKNRIFVISTGFVGNNKRPVDVNICKGFTLVDEYCPFIYINTNNLGGGRIFTLIHELVHIFVGKSIGFSYEPIEPSSQPLEKFCDTVASEILVPEFFFKVAWKSQSSSSIEKFTILANQFHVSKLVIAKKALDSNFIVEKEFWDFYNIYKKNYKKIKKTGGQYWNSKPYEVSRKFYEYVDVALRQGTILHSAAYKLTNMKGKTYESFKKKGF